MREMRLNKREIKDPDMLRDIIESCAYRSIMGNGTIRELTGEQEKIHALTQIMEHMAPGARIEFRRERLERTGVYRIYVKYFTGKERSRNFRG